MTRVLSRQSSETFSPFNGDRHNFHKKRTLKSTTLVPLLSIIIGISAVAFIIFAFSDNPPESSEAVGGSSSGISNTTIELPNTGDQVREEPENTSSSAVSTAAPDIGVAAIGGSTSSATSSTSISAVSSLPSTGIMTGSNRTAMIAFNVMILLAGFGLAIFKPKFSLRVSGSGSKFERGVSRQFERMKS